MKDEQQLHGASPELSLHHIVVKSDLKTRRGAAERKVNVSRQKMREYSQMSETTDEGDKSFCVKPDISVWASANNDSCTSNIDSKIEHRFKRKFAYLI